MKQSSVYVRGLLLLSMLALLTVCPALAAEDTVCIQCHSGLDEKYSVPVAQWQESVHKQNGISCHDCHGGDPTDFALAMEPERGFVGVPEYTEVPEFCGRCHVGVKEDYLASAHGQALEAGGAQCVVCHSNHRIAYASIDLINEKTCSQCHDYERAERVKAEISATEETLAGLEESVANLHRVGIDTSALDDGLFASRNSFRRIFHTVNIDRIRQQKAEFDEELQKAGVTIGAYEETLGQRKLAGGAVVLLLLLGGVIAMLIRRSYHDEE